MDDLSYIFKYCKHINGLTGIDCSPFDIRQRSLLNSDNHFCNFCLSCNCHNTHLYGCYEAKRWGCKYIYYCPKGYIFISVAVLNDNDIDIMDYAVITGPISMDDDSPNKNKISELSTAQVTHLSEILFKIFCTSPQKFENSDSYLSNIYNAVDESNSKYKINYPIALEKELQKAIIDKNLSLSNELLNKLLGYIFFSSNTNFEIIKARVMELIVLLSRSAIDGGADINQIFALNSDYIKNLEHFNNIDKLSIWLTGVLKCFISYIFDFSDVKHSDIIFKVTAFIKANYMNKISLDDIANHVFLSKSYLSKIFKEEMNSSLVSFINKFRIDKSKQLLIETNFSLIEIANNVGFDDQSYFTTVFKNFVGISPGKFREKRGH